jgi:hypothetical protein
MAVILPSVYKDGTATVAANGVAVTGQGTMWLNTVLPGDFFGTHKGAPNRILAVNSNTSLTLAYPWLGGAQASAAYEIMYQSDNARMQETARQLLEKLSSGNVDALAGLDGAAGRIPYFTGVGAMGWISSGIKGREILFAADTPAALAALGPGAGYPTAPSASGVGMSDGDLNTITYPGDYALSSNYVNGPLLSGAASPYSGALEVRRRSGSLAGIWQTLRLATRTWERYSGTTDGSTWLDWGVIDSATVGTVANNAGQPSGAIIERGSNANGEYVRYADGTQMCWKPSAFVATSFESPTGNVFANAGGNLLWTYPIAFYSSSTTVGTVVSVATVTRWGITISASASSMQGRILSTVSQPAAGSADGFAIGRWAA